MDACRWTTCMYMAQSHRAPNQDFNVRIDITELIYVTPETGRRLLRKLPASVMTLSFSFLAMDHLPL